MPGRSESNLTSVFYKNISQIDIFISTCEIGTRWVPQNPNDDKSTLVQVMAWCRQTTDHYLSQFDPNVCHHMVPPGHNELSILFSFCRMIEQRTVRSFYLFSKKKKDIFRCLLGGNSFVICIFIYRSNISAFHSKIVCEHCIPNRCIWISTVKHFIRNMFYCQS